MPNPLSQEPRRCDLTDRECASIIGGLLGSLSQNSNLETVRNTVRWWAENDKAWEFMRIGAETLKEPGLAQKWEEFFQ